MTVSVLVPYRAGCPHRERAWAWVQGRYSAVHGDWQLVAADGGDGPFSRSQAILEAASRADGDMLVVADADVWVDGIDQAVVEAASTGWAIPHLYVHRLSEPSTDRLLTEPGIDWRALPLSTDNAQDSRPYIGHETGTLVVLDRHVLEDVPPDTRFVGWGREDDAWSLALRLLVGPPWRGGHDLLHCWHPPQQRPSRVKGSPETEALYRRYRLARNDPDRMRALLAEATRTEARCPS